jgi:formylglycine-generating enzyme required for sulfatase activity
MITAVAVVGQPTQRTLRGTVLDSKTKLPLSRATIRIQSQGFETASNANGEFACQISNHEADSIEISHVGYRTFKGRLMDLPSEAVIPLEDYSLQLRTVTITSRKLNLKNVDNSLRRVKGNLYTYETETTNGMYNLFLNFLEEQDDQELLKLCDYDLITYNEEDKKFYNNYGRPFKGVQVKNDTSERDFTDFPAVNVSHEGATLFCQWFTEQYNNHTGKKKFKKVKFRLPTVNEWQIAALGYPKFQSWNLDENNVEAIVPDDTLSEIKKGRKAVISVKEIQYPWWNHYHYRNKVTNIKNCYLGNFDAPRQKTPCEYGRPLPGNDGWTKMARTAAYFPNDIGLYDIVGNVAEMIDEKGKALGGSWNDKPEDSTIRSVKRYNQADGTIGFRVFMEVVEE